MRVDAAIDRGGWNRHRAKILAAAAICLATLALLKLGSELYRLVLSTASNAAIDLALRHEETHWWFAGKPVYTGLERITYPPAAYLCFWPLLGWIDLPASRVLWAVTTVAMLAWLVRLLIHGSGASSPMDRLLVALIGLSMNAVGVAVGNGQLVLHLLPPMIAALLLLRDPRNGWARDLAASGLAVVALIKPTLSLPFFWVAVVSARRVRPFALTAALYAGVTLIAAGFQQRAPLALIADWLSQAGRYLEGGYGDVQSVSLALGFGAWIEVPSLILFVGLGAWIWRHRDADFWILVGVSALVARFWTYHRNYDDTLILLPLIALFRLAIGRSDHHAPDATAGVLCAVGVLVMLAPARLEFAGPPLSFLYIWGHVITWLIMLGYLAWAAAMRAIPSASTIVADTVRPGAWRN